ncbi:MAG: hypothetical protein U9N06_04470 [candidate division WOR-3 bacterium]|nr:hypothetical protein [candidate division WOR-3 bacterium]
MDKEVIDYFSGELNWFKRSFFKLRIKRNPIIKKKLKEYKEAWDILLEWEETIELPEIDLVQKVSFPLRLKPAFLLAIGIIGLGIGFYFGLKSYTSTFDYMNYATEVLYEE